MKAISELLVGRLPVPEWFGRALVGIAMAAGGATFLGMGLLFWFGAGLAGLWFGAGFIAIGGLTLLMAPIWVWRGGRLGAEIKDNSLIVHSYFRDNVTPLHGLLRVFRSVDATVLEFVDKQVVVDDSYFSDLTVRDSLYQSLLLRLATSASRSVAPVASPNSGPAEPSGNSAVSGGPPSVS